jgi:hypothetical protein
MSKGSSYLFSGTNTGSQPYSDTYHVISEELTNDKKDADIYNPQTGYFKNPTATKLEDSINCNHIVFCNHRAEGRMTYVLDINGSIVYGKRCNPNNSSKRSPHPTLVGGENPEVQCAGIIEFRKGRIYSIDNLSGHFRPNQKSMKKVYAVLSELRKKKPNLFDKHFQWEE